MIINDLLIVTEHSTCLLFADDIKMFVLFSLLQSDSKFTKSLGVANFKKVNVSKTRVITFVRK